MFLVKYNWFDIEFSQARSSAPEDLEIQTAMAAHDIRRLRSNSTKTIAANKDRLKAFAQTLDSELEAELLGPISSLSSSSVVTPKSENWRDALLSCGSDAFSQLCVKTSDLMTTSMKQTTMPKETQEPTMGSVMDLDFGY